MQAKKSLEKPQTKQVYSQIPKTFFSDLVAPNMLFAKIIRSPIVHGKIKSISLQNIPKGYYFFTAKDFGTQNYVETLDIQTQILAEEDIFYKGQAIAIIAGPVYKELEELEKQVNIEFIKTPQSKLNEKEYPYAQRFIRNGKAQKPEAFSKLFSKKNFNIKSSWTSVLNAPSCNEPNGAFCSFEKGTLTVCTPTQWPKQLLETLKRVFDLKTENIVIKKTISSSPHTNTIWLNTVLCTIASLVTLKTKLPVRLVLSRNEQFEYMTKKSSVTIKIHSSVKKDGTIEATQILIDLDSGYHNPFAAEILDRLVIAANNIYSVRHIEIIAKAYESFTHPVSFNIESIDSQAFFAIENQMQKICKVTGFLPAELRIKNFERKFSVPFTFKNERVNEAFEAISQQSDLNRKFIAYQLESKNRKLSLENIQNIPLRGIGASCGFNGIGYFGTNIFSTNQKMDATLEADGSLTIHALTPSPATLEIWKKTASEILELDPKQIVLNTVFDIHDELAVPQNVYSNISIMTYLLKKCCLDIQAKRFRKPLPISSSKGFTTTQKKGWNKDKFSGIPFFATSFGSMVVELEIDPCTFHIKIKKIFVLINAGKIHIPRAAQMAVKLSIQHVLSEIIVDETLTYDKIFISFMNSDTDPTEIDGLISRLLPAAFTSALSQAIGQEINELPVNPQKIFKELFAYENTSDSK